MNRVPGNQLGFEFGPLALFLSLSLSLFLSHSSLSRWFEDLRKTWSRDEWVQLLLLRARAGALSRWEARSRSHLYPQCASTPLYFWRSFPLSFLPSFISFKPPTVALGFSSSSSTRLSLFFLNLIFYLVTLLSRNMILLYCTSCTAFCYYGEVANRCCCQGNKELVSFSSKKACRGLLQKNWMNIIQRITYKYFLRFRLNRNHVRDRVFNRIVEKYSIFVLSK